MIGGLFISPKKYTVARHTKFHAARPVETSLVSSHTHFSHDRDNVNFPHKRFP